MWLNAIPNPTELSQRPATVAAEPKHRDLHGVELQSSGKLVASISMGISDVPEMIDSGNAANHTMTDEVNRISLAEIAKKPWPERVQFFLKHLQSLRPAMEQFIETAYEVSGAAATGVDRSRFVNENRDAFSLESLCRLLATRLCRKANGEGIKPDELPVDAFQIEPGRTVLNGKSLTLESSFSEYDQWLALQSEGRRLSRLAELAFVRACEEGCHTDRSHSTRSVFGWFYQYFGGQVEQRLTSKFGPLLSPDFADAAVSRALKEFYSTYIVASDDDNLHVKQGWTTRSRWAGRQFLENLLLLIAVRRLPTLYYVMTPASFQILRSLKLPDVVIEKLGEVAGFTFRKPDQIVAVALAADPGLTAQQRLDIQNGISRTFDPNPRPKPSPSGRSSGKLSDRKGAVDTLLEAIVRNEVPARATFASLTETARGCRQHEELMETGQQLIECIKRTTNEACQCEFARQGGCCLSENPMLELTAVEQVRLIDYLYHNPPDSAKVNRAAECYSRVDGWRKLKRRKCLSRVLGTGLLASAAQQLRVHLKSQTLPPGGLLSLLFSKEQTENIWSDNDPMISLAIDYHFEGYPVRRLMTPMRKKQYAMVLQEEPHLKESLAGLMMRDLSTHWKNTAGDVERVFAFLADQFSKRGG